MNYLVLMVVGLLSLSISSTPAWAKPVKKAPAKVSHQSKLPAKKAAKSTGKATRKTASKKETAKNPEKKHISAKTAKANKKDQHVKKAKAQPKTASKAPVHMKGQEIAKSSVSEKPAKTSNETNRGLAALASGPGDAGPAVGEERALQVRGQGRQLSMMLVLKNEKDKIDFVNLRTNYKTEIMNTEF